MITKRIRCLVVAVALGLATAVVISPTDVSYAASSSKNAAAKSLVVYYDEVPDADHADWKKPKLSPKFKSDKRIYKAYFSADSSEKSMVKVTLTKAHKNAEIYYRTDPTAKWRHKKGSGLTVKFKLDNGYEKTVYFRIKSQDKKHKQTYQLTVRRYLINAEVDKIVDKAVKQIIRPDMTMAQKIWAVQKWITANITYDSDYYYDQNGEVNPYYGLTGGRGVCYHFTAAFHIFMDYLNVPFLTVSGRHGGTDHVWSNIRLDGAWYNVDPTWGARYFLRSDEFTAQTRTVIYRDKKYWHNGRYNDARKTGFPNDYPERDELLRH
jgi:transglutaminase/protease-like cytokinesis protein 3